MGVAAYGRKIAESATEVRDEVRTSPDGDVEGVVVIDRAAPTERWHVEGTGASSGLAARVAARAYRRFESTGSWPDRAAHQA